MRVREVSKQELHVLNDDGSIVAGINVGYYRPWIYPLCTPSGINVLREFPPDHGFHNGAFFGHYPVIYKGVEYNFWGAPPVRGPDDILSTNICRISTEISSIKCESQLTAIELICTWSSIDGLDLMIEKRSHHIMCNKAETRYMCKTSLRSKVSEPIKLSKTKFSGHTFRLTPYLFSNDVFITNKYYGVDTDSLHGQAFAGQRFKFRLGNVYMTVGASENCHFFLREYGLMSINPFLRADRTLKKDVPFEYYSSVSIS